MLEGPKSKLLEFVDFDISDLDEGPYNCKIAEFISYIFLVIEGPFLCSSCLIKVQGTSCDTYLVP